MWAQREIRMQPLPRGFHLITREVLAAVGNTISELMYELLGHPDGPLTAAFERAAGFLRGWWGEPPGPSFAPEG